MTPERNQPEKTQSDANNTEPVNSPHTPQHRPDWIIPDNGISTSNSGRSGANQTSGEERQGNSSIPMDEEDTLGIP